MRTSDSIFHLAISTKRGSDRRKGRGENAELSDCNLSCKGGFSAVGLMCVHELSGKMEGVASSISLGRILWSTGERLSCRASERRENQHAHNDEGEKTSS